MEELLGGRAARQGSAGTKGNFGGFVFSSGRLIKFVSQGLGRGLRDGGSATAGDQRLGTTRRCLGDHGETGTGTPGPAF